MYIFIHMCVVFLFVSYLPPSLSSLLSPSTFPPLCVFCFSFNLLLRIKRLCYKLVFVCDFCLENKNVAWLILKTIAYTYNSSSSSSSSGVHGILLLIYLFLSHSNLFSYSSPSFLLLFLYFLPPPFESTSFVLSISFLFLSFVYFHALSIYMRRRISARVKMAILHINDCHNKYEMKTELNDEIFIICFRSLSILRHIHCPNVTMYATRNGIALIEC